MRHDFTRRSRRQSAALASTLAAALLLAGCTAGGGAAPRPGGGSARAGGTFTETIDHDAFRQMGYRLLWTGAAATSSRGVVTRADVLGDAVVVQESGGAVTLIQTSDGRTRWSVALGERLTRFLGNARAGNRVLVASDVELYVLDADTGDLRDRQSLDLIVSTPPLVAPEDAGPGARDVVIFGSRNGRVLAHDLRSGLGRWQYQLEGAIETAPVAVGDHVGLISESGDVIIVNPATGSAAARARVFDGPGAAPAATDSIIAFTCRDQSAYAFTGDGGARLWRYRTERPLTTPMAIIEGVAYFTVPGKGLIGLNASTGREVWRAAGAAGEVLGKAGGALIVRNGDTITAYDAQGAQIVSADVPGLHEVVMPSAVGGDLYLITRRGAVSRFVPTTDG